MKRTLSHLVAVTVAALISALPATAHDSKGLVLGPDEGERLIRRWGYPFLMKVDEINGGAKQFVVGSEKLPPGKSIQVHRHDYAEEILVIMAGKGTAVLGDKKVSIDPGTLVFIPQHTWAGLDNTGTETIDLLWMFPKPGVEKYFRATSVAEGQPIPALSEEEMNQIRAFHSEYVTYRNEKLTGYTTGDPSIDGVPEKK